MLFNILTLMCSTLPPKGKHWEHTSSPGRDLTLTFHTPGQERLGNLLKSTQLIGNRAEIRSGIGFLIVLAPEEGWETWRSRTPVFQILSLTYCTWFNPPQNPDSSSAVLQTRGRRHRQAQEHAPGHSATSGAICQAHSLTPEPSLCSCRSSSTLCLFGQVAIILDLLMFFPRVF